MLDESRGGEVLDPLDHPAALAPDPATAHVEDLDRRLELVLGQREDVRVGRVAENDGVRASARSSAPMSSRSRAARSKSSSAAAVRISRSSALTKRSVLPAMKSQKSSASARCSSSLTRSTHGAEHLPISRAGTAGRSGGALEDARTAGAHREDPQQQVDRLADRPGVRVGPEVAGALALGAAHHLDPGELLAHRDREVRVGLVVAVLDVEPGIELLDPGVLQLERLDLGGHDRPLDAARRS